VLADFVSRNFYVDLLPSLHGCDIGIGKHAHPNSTLRLTLLVTVNHTYVALLHSKRCTVNKTYNKVNSYHYLFVVVLVVVVVVVRVAAEQ
jgi:hypothetical protein